MTARTGIPDTVLGDEIAAIQAEDERDAQAAWLEYRDSRPRALNDHARKAVLRSLRKRDFIAGFIAGRQS